MAPADAVAPSKGATTNHRRRPPRMERPSRPPRVAQSGRREPKPRRRRQWPPVPKARTRPRPFVGPPPRKPPLLASDRIIRPCRVEGLGRTSPVAPGPTLGRPAHRTSHRRARIDRPTLGRIATGHRDRPVMVPAARVRFVSVLSGCRRTRTYRKHPASHPRPRGMRVRRTPTISHTGERRTVWPTGPVRIGGRTLWSGGVGSAVGSAGIPCHGRCTPGLHGRNWRSKSPVIRE